MRWCKIDADEQWYMRFGMGIWRRDPVMEAEAGRS